MYSLKDKVAIVTGGANGIGAHIVQEFIKEGTKYVAIVDIDETSGETLENKLKAEYGRDVAGFFKCDITKDDVLYGIFDKIVKDFGAIDVVVNNAGICSETMNTYKKLIEINFYVAIVDIDETSGETLENKLKAEYGRDVAGFFKCDITKDDVLYGIFDKIVKDFGAIDVVVNNAGICSETMNTYKKLIEINFYVAIVDIDETSGETLENKLKAEYGRDVAGFFKCDITKDDVLYGIFDKIVKDFGAIDVVVNNAGICSETMNTYKKLIEINFTATVSSTLKALELMRADRGGAGGTIINISSIAALTLMSPSVFIYGASKSAVLHLSVCMGEAYYRHTNVRVLTMCFGATETNIGVQSFDQCIIDNLLKRMRMAKLENFMQPPIVAAQGVIEGYKTGKSGSTWLIDEGKITDITDRIYDGFKILSAGIKH